MQEAKYSQYKPAYQGKISFFSRLSLIIKLLVLLFFIYSLIYIFNILNASAIAIEYDGGLCNTEKSINIAKAQLAQGLKKQAEYWQALNFLAKDDRAKPIPFILCMLSKSIGIKIHLLAKREPEGKEEFIKKWGKYVNYIHFTPEPNDEYLLLEKYKPLFFAAQSDESLAQAVKANIKPIRLKRAIGSKLSGEYNPGKFGEKSIPFSQLP